MAVPYTFGTATAAIPLSNLDSNFATTITLGNTAIQLGNTVTTLNNMTLANATISSGNVTLTNVTVTTANVTTGNITTLAVGSGGIKSAGNVVVGTTDFTNTAVTGAVAVNGYGIYPYVSTGTTNTTSFSGIQWYTPTAFAGNNGASAQALLGMNSSINIKNDGTGGSNANTGTGISSLNYVESSAVGGRVSLRGVAIDARRSSATDLSTVSTNSLFGIISTVAHGAGALSTIVSNSVHNYNANTFNAGGNVSTLSGLVSSITSGTLTGNTTVTTNAYNINLTGFAVGAATGNSATVTAGASFYAAGPQVSATGTMTTFYGLYLGAATVTGTLTNNWGVYSADTAATNYFGGNVGIGTTSPSKKLDVYSTTQRNQIAMSGSNVVAIRWNTTDPNSGERNWEISNNIDGQGFLSFRVGATQTADPTTTRMTISSAGIVTMSAYGAGAATFSAAGVISSVSDETWKIKDGVPVDTDAMLKKLEPGYWYYNDEKKETFGADRQLGFYAQNVNAAIGPEAAPEPEEGKPWGYYDRSVLAVTVMSLQKALATIESLTARIAALESR